jgi:hypothetical protein
LRSKVFRNLSKYNERLPLNVMKIVAYKGL